MTSFYAPLEGDLIRSKYADRLIKILLECSRDFGSQLPAAICCDLNRNPSECAHLNVALARTGWTDLGQLGTGEAESPPTHYPFGAAHKGMQGLGCSRIDLLLVNTVALAAFTKYDQSMDMVLPNTQGSLPNLTCLRLVRKSRCLGHPAPW